MAWMDHIKTVKRIHLSAWDKEGRQRVLAISENLYAKIQKFAREASEEAAYLRRCEYNQKRRVKRFKRNKMRYKR